MNSTKNSIISVISTTTLQERLGTKQDKICYHCQYYEEEMEIVKFFLSYLKGRFFLNEEFKAIKPLLLAAIAKPNKAMT